MKTVVRCSNFERSRDFYIRVLNLYALEEWSEPQGRGAIFALAEDGEGCFEIYEMAPADPRFDESFRRSLENDKIDLQLRTNSVAAWSTRLHGVWEFEGPEDLPWGQRWIKLRDPDRLLIAIYEESASR